MKLLILTLIVGATHGCASGDAPSNGDPACPDPFACTADGVLAAISSGCPGVLTFDCSEPTTVVLEQGIDIASEVALDGEGILTLRAECCDRLLRVTGDGNVALSHLTIDQGGIDNDGQLQLDDVVITPFSSLAGTFETGGGVRNTGTLSISRSAIVDNIASDIDGNVGAGAGIWNSGQLLLSESTVSGNEARGDSVARGGGIYNSGMMRVEASTISMNSANRDFSAVRGEGGAGIFNEGTMTLLNSTLSGNDAFDFGGGIHNRGMARWSSSVRIRHRSPSSGSCRYRARPSLRGRGARGRAR